ncbi:hypothetical protein BU23DRAFT_592152 [Bimuria novae-zelandiae CBS 107.79]|uniref:Uncharacterized protein n=1 Tax=Bimuria novae-zelandiae CBS 107.79 TaxID=1447943 RepID=A0A6A5UX36_9PLEO|nr:hypothetical protein BU23DRAFT_592152 [Bimuria novae-zelandiae CBS 107.79]
MARPGGRGRGRDGAGRGASGDTGQNRTTGSAPNKQPCFTFRNTGFCKNGSACRYSHDLASNPQGHGSTRRARWRSILREHPGQNDLPKIQKLWDGALSILNGDDRDTKQYISQDLDNEDQFQGRQYILIVMTLRPLPAQYEMFVDVCRAFLLVMTHPAFVDCLATDTYVGSLYNYLSGPNGNRAMSFFQKLCEVLIGMRTEESNSHLVKELDSTLIALTSVLLELLKREHRARRNPDLPTLVDSLDTAAQLVANIGSSYISTVVLQRVSNLRAVVARAEALIAGITDTLADLTLDSGPTSAYPQRRIMPENRHDNDKTDITEVIIFPTSDEIKSDVQEFLPSTQPEEWHYLSSIERHIDTHFRLFRQDSFGALKVTLANIMGSVAKVPEQLMNPKHNFGDTRAYVYTEATVGLLAFGSRGREQGLQAYVSFLQPLSVRNRTLNDQQRWWDDSRRLADGVLMSFIWIEHGRVHHTFFTITNQEVDDETEKQMGRDNTRKIISVKLMTETQSTIGTLIDLCYHKTRGLLLEFPNIIPATFVPVLENLQNMQRLGRLPFSQWIIPDCSTEAFLDIPAPLYARKPGFQFSLKSILLRDGDSPVYINATSSSGDEELIAEMEAKVGLDHGQCRAMIAALTREFAFIQGPPGTGKTHLGVKLMKILLDVKEKADLGPIVVVCYTNHALDQFLEHLVKTGLKKVIRIGGRSRSQLLEDHNLRVIAQSEPKTKSEGRQIYEAYKELEEYEEDIKSTLSELTSAPKRLTWNDFVDYLRDNHASIHSQFHRHEEDGFKQVGRHPFDIWIQELLRKASKMPAQPAASLQRLAAIKKKAAMDMHSLSVWEGYTLVQYFIGELRQSSKAEFFETFTDAIATQRHLKDVQEEVRRRVLQDADVIGLTTTGLAKNIATLQRVQCKVVICEEAGEVMEAHMLSAMLPTVEHCIQIGDHEQLRPTINEYDLSLESPKGRLYQLDRSQFERCSLGETGRPRIPTVQLDTQRRMRPEISKLIRETIYPKLIDHPSTVDREDVVGMRQNVFWLDHKHVEDQKQAEVNHTKSKSNAWEVEMTHALIRHLIRQGAYKSTEIAVLTPYTGQLQHLRAVMRADFEIVLSDIDEEKLAREGFEAEDKPKDNTVAATEQSNRKRPLEMKKMTDLFSNPDQKVGFLRTTNRINVLLSRARNGMYLIGNTDTYSNVPMWQKVIALLGAKGCVGTSLALCCPRHPDKIISVDQPDDFGKYSPEGGCRERCDKRLSECGHMCQARCHSDSMHDVWSCELPCERLHKPCNHPCQKATCGEECGRCMVKRNDVQLPCGHIQNNVDCHRTQHLDQIPCHMPTTKDSPGCGHTVQVKCSEDVTKAGFRCPASCGTVLACGHACPGSCGGCNRKDKDGNATVQHQKCTKKCGRRFGTCNHNCSQRCHDGSDCGLCEAPCEVRCDHSRCSLKCHEAYAPCIMKCTWSCEHQGDCTMPCAAPCNRLPCDKRCTLRIPCGHQCPSLCGETCPAGYCQECGMRSDEEVDMIEFKPYAEIDLNDTPIVVLGCGHFFTAETLDGLAGLLDVYEVDGRTGEISGLKDLSGQLSLKIPTCPHCRTPIRQHVTQRYNRLINRAVIDEMSKRFIVSGQTELQEFESQLQQVEQELEQSRAAAVQYDQTTHTTEGASRYGKEMTSRLRKRYGSSPYKLTNLITNFEERVKDRHEPAHKLHFATASFMQKQLESPSASNALLDTIPHAADHRRIAYGAKMMKIKATATICEDKFLILATVKSKCAEAIPSVKMYGLLPKDEAPMFLKFCTLFIGDCEKNSLPKLAIEATLYYARIARRFQTNGPMDDQGRKLAAKYRDTAKEFLEKAQGLCSRPFKGADALLEGVNEAIKMLRDKWYEEVTPEEIAAIKKAMVSGAGGIATHSGHWYDCVNGHTFAIGECGMPMQQARCPECGERIGGQNHQAVAGVRRAQHMED